jgi:hypothetical protein
MQLGVSKIDPQLFATAIRTGLAQFTPAFGSPGCKVGSIKPM